MTATELRDILARELAKANDGGVARWRKVLGTVKVYPLTTHAHCNWEIAPSGPLRDVAIAERMIDTVRFAHPIVEAD